MWREGSRSTRASCLALKRGQDMRVSTLRRYLGALGFDLEITAVAGNKRIVIRREHAHR